MQAGVAGRAMKVAVLGATGHTGKLVVRAAR